MFIFFQNTKKTYFLIGILFLTVSLAGCDFSTGIKKPDTVPSGNYIIKVYDDTKIYAYNGGGGLFVIARGALVDEAQDLYLNIECDESLGAKLFPQILTYRSWIAELSIKPEKSIKAGIYPIYLIYEQSGIKDTIQLQVDIVEWNPKYHPELPPDRPPNYVITELKKNNYCTDINGNENWQSFIYSTSYGSFSNISRQYLSDKYEILQSSWVMYPDVCETWIAYRRRYVDLNFSFVLRSWDGNQFSIMDTYTDFYVRFREYGFKRRY